MISVVCQTSPGSFSFPLLRPRPQHHRGLRPILLGVAFASTSLLPDLMRKPRNLCPSKRLHAFTPSVPAELKSFARVFQRQSGSFLPRSMVSHLMCICSAQMRVRREIV
jgi:hypothetical protein